MRANFCNGLMFGAGILLVIVVGIAVAVAADILTVDKDGTIRLRVSDTGKVTLNTNEPAQGDMRFTPRASDPTAPLAGDLWYNDTVKEVKYADGGITKPIASMTDAALALYVNGTTGDDNNSGLAADEAVKTIQKAVNLVPPIVRHAVTINVAEGTYRDTGATIGSTTINVYVADKVVTISGAITFVGDEATPANVRVTGSDAGADTTPVRKYGFYIRSVSNVNLKGFLVNYFSVRGAQCTHAGGGFFESCQFNNNSDSGVAVGYSMGLEIRKCTFNNNGYVGVYIDTNSFVGFNWAGIVGNGNIFSGNNGHGIYVRYGAGLVSYYSTGSGNSGWGAYAEWGGHIDTRGTGSPTGSSGNLGYDSTKQAYAE